MKNYLFILFILSFTNSQAQPDTSSLFDQSRNRRIPIAVYTNKSTKTTGKPLVIVSHGYSQNVGTPYLAYASVAEMLAANGYFVVSIQHELPSDSLMPITGVPQVVRRPFWDRGADNIQFVINAFQKSNPELDIKHITLIGHSNGGDMSALFPQKYPGIVDKVITLDNRRMALPRTSNPKIFTLRSSDLPADEGVLPSEDEQKMFKTTVIKLPDTIHNDMNDHATPAQRKEINDYILAFLGQ